MLGLSVMWPVEQAQRNKEGVITNAKSISCVYTYSWDENSWLYIQSQYIIVSSKYKLAKQYSLGKINSIISKRNDTSQCVQKQSEISSCLELGDMYSIVHNVIYTEVNGCVNLPLYRCWQTHTAVQSDLY